MKITQDHSTLSGSASHTIKWLHVMISTSCPVTSLTDECKLKPLTSNIDRSPEAIGNQENQSQNEAGTVKILKKSWNRFLTTAMVKSDWPVFEERLGQWIR